MSKPLIESLANLLADSYVLALKTQNYHWNVTGPHFAALHALFEEQYTELRDAADELAERIRALKEFSPGSYAAFSKLTAIEEASDEHIDAAQMVAALAADHEILAKRAQQGIETAEAADDPVSADLFTERASVHEKTAWMLRSSS